MPNLDNLTGRGIEAVMIGGGMSDNDLVLVPRPIGDWKMMEMPILIFSF